MTKTPYIRFVEHRANATRRGIPFLLTFDEWWDIWETSGKWELRGVGLGKFVMSRTGDVGPYAIGNVFIQTHSNNTRDSNLKLSSHKARVMTKLNKGRSRACSVDGVTIYPTTRALREALGQGIHGSKHPGFRYV